MKLQPVSDPSVCGALTSAVEIVRENLVGHKQSQKLRRARARERPKHRRTVNHRPLASERSERVSTKCRTRDGTCEVTPAFDLAGHIAQPPSELAVRRSKESENRPWR